MQEFNRPNIKTLREEIDNALKSIAEKHGISLMLGNVRFSDRSFTGKLEARITDTHGEPTMAVDFRTLADTYGLKPENLYRMVTIQGKTYKIVGLKPRNRKYPIIVEEITNGKRYKFSAFVIRESL